MSTVDGQTYERAAIETWLDDHCTSPLTGSPLASRVLVPNIAVRNAILRLRACPDQLPDGLTPAIEGRRASNKEN